MSTWFLIRLYLKIKPQIDQLQKELRQASMKLSTNVIVQILGTIGQLLVNTTSIIPATSPIQKWLAIGIAAVQGTVAIISHFSNPNGTPATQPYIPPTT